MHNIIISVVYILGVTNISTRVGSIGGGTRITIEGGGTYIIYSMIVTFAKISCLSENLTS